MKKLQTVLYVIVALFLFSPSLSAQEEKTAQQIETEKKMLEAIKSQHFGLQITQIYPRDLPSIESSGEYVLLMEGDVVSTRLPYIGSAGGIMIDGEDLSIVFDKEEVEVKQDFSKWESDGEAVLSFSGSTQSTRWDVKLRIFVNGQVKIDCTSPRRGYMSYEANFVILKQDENNN